MINATRSPLDRFLAIATALPTVQSEAVPGQPVVSPVQLAAVPRRPVAFLTLLAAALVPSPIAPALLFPLPKEESGGCNHSDVPQVGGRMRSILPLL
jgi:hypothetical protein